MINRLQIKVKTNQKIKTFPNKFKFKVMNKNNNNLIQL